MSVMKIKLADMVSPLSRRLLFPHMKIFLHMRGLILTSLSGAFLQCCQKYSKWVLEFGRVVLQIHFFVTALTNAAKKKKEMKKLPISNLLPRKRFEADLKYNS